MGCTKCEKVQILIRSVEVRGRWHLDLPYELSISTQDFKELSREKGGFRGSEDGSMQPTK
jgi:hypothetical protein